MKALEPWRAPFLMTFGERQIEILHNLLAILYTFGAFGFKLRLAVALSFFSGRHSHLSAMKVKWLCQSVLFKIRGDEAINVVTLKTTLSFVELLTA